MDLISIVPIWAYELIATWCGAATIGGILIVALQRWDKQRKPSEADVERVAEQYRQRYGKEAINKIGDHMLAASFLPDGTHRRFLKLVSQRLQDP